MVINGMITALKPVGSSSEHLPHNWVQPQACRQAGISRVPKMKAVCFSRWKGHVQSSGPRNVVGVVLRISSNGSLFLIPWAGNQGTPDIPLSSPSLASPSLRLVSFHIVSSLFTCQSLLPPSLQNRSPLFRAWRMATTSWRMTCRAISYWVLFLQFSPSTVWASNMVC